jgi:hypothetical protein
MTCCIVDVAIGRRPCRLSSAVRAGRSTHPAEAPPNTCPICINERQVHTGNGPVMDHAEYTEERPQQ